MKSESFDSWCIKGWTNRDRQLSGPLTLVPEIVDSEAPHISAERPKPSTAAGVRSHSPPLESEREAAAKAVGCFLRRALEGQRRGESGRDRIPQSSRYWLVIRGIDNQVFSPIRVFSKWASAKPLVKRGADCGESAFVGLPAMEDIKLAVAAGASLGKALRDDSSRTAGRRGRGQLG